MTEYKIQSLDKLFHRSIGKHLKKKIYRTALEYEIQLFKQIHAEIIFFKPDFWKENTKDLTKF